VFGERAGGVGGWDVGDEVEELMVVEIRWRGCGSWGR